MVVVDWEPTPPAAAAEFVVKKTIELPTAKWKRFAGNLQLRRLRDYFQTLRLRARASKATSE